MTSHHHTMARAISRTWARRCDGHVFTSTRPDSMLPAFSVGDFRGKEFLNLRLQRSLRVVFDKFMSGFDWLYVSDDDTYVIVENLRYFLATFDHNNPHYLGYAYPTTHDGKTMYSFAHGGSGYALSRATLRLYIERGLDSKPVLCPPSGPFPNYWADANLGFCMWRLGLRINSTLDRYGRQRFVKENPIDILRDKKTGETTLYGYRDVIVTPKRVGHT